MYAVKKEKDEDLWTVGIVDGSVWMSLRDFDRLDRAFAFINYLNGGKGKVWDW